MIIDGRKVLYSVKAKKLVYPEIPTEGLVCYLDARGKTNTDKHKGTLIDLSGNGNHGTLQNFSFTDGSGFENGGLKFDGVDDKITPIPFDTTATDDYTAYIDFTLADNLPIIGLVPILWSNLDVFMLSVTHEVQSLRYYVGNVDGTTGHTNAFKKLQSGNRHKIIAVREGLVFKIFVDGVKIIEKTFSSKTKQAAGGLYIFNNPWSTTQLNPSKLHKAALYNRALTDEEVQQLLTA